MLLNFGIGQATDILEMFQKSAQYEDFEVIKDYGGIERALYCRRSKDDYRKKIIVGSKLL